MTRFVLYYKMCMNRVFWKGEAAHDANSEKDGLPA